MNDIGLDAFSIQNFNANDDMINEFDHIYFVEDEHFNSSSDFELETELSNQNTIKLISGMEFQSWDQLEIHLNQYALQEGFSYKKTRLEYHMNQSEMKYFTKEEKAAQIKRRTYECSHSRIHTSKKVVQLDKQRNQEIQQIGCLWHINTTKLKNQSIVRIASLNLTHNHIMNPRIHEMAPKFRKFTKSMCEDIEFYVKNGLTSATSIFPLLRAKYPNHSIHKKDLYNAIQKYKVGKNDIVENDAANLLRYLANKRSQDSDWFFEFRLTGNEQRLTSLIWISPEQ